jgi:hypothetical protein
MDTLQLLKDMAITGDSDELYEAGKRARAAGLGRDEGWKAIAEEKGYSRYGRTPARERFEDGFYGA